MAVFSYATVDPESDEIRVVRFINKPNEPLALDLQHKSRTGNLEYAAISYTWADMRDTVEITVNDSSLPISRNLYNCLQQLCLDGVKSWLWADSICINQANLQEKKRVVARMDHIYGNARLVYSWLGLSSPGTDQVMSWLERIGSQAPPAFLEAMYSGNMPHHDIQRYISTRLPGQPNDDDVSGKSEISCFLYSILNNAEARSTDFKDEMYNFLRKDYWHRIWIIQEVALAKDVSFMCGSKHVCVKDLDTALSAIKYCTANGLFNLHNDYQDFCCITSPYDIRSLEIRRQKILGRPVDLQSILFIFVKAPGRPHYSATDPRDIAFGLVGVLTDESRRLLTIDYELRVEEVFTMITKAMLYPLPHDRGFNLDWCIPKEDNMSMPSWVPNWMQIGRYGFPVWPIAYGTAFKATAGMQIPRRLSNTGFTDSIFLRYYGYYVDEITEVLEPPSWKQVSEWDLPEPENTTLWLDSVYQFTGLGSESGSAEDYIWRSLLRGYNTLANNFGNSAMNEDVLQLIRHLLRREPINAAALSEAQWDFLRSSYIIPTIMDDLGNVETQLQDFCQEWVSRIMSDACMKQRTLFKTRKLMFGVGHRAIKVGDVVTLLSGIRSPIILRKGGPEAGFLFVGDAYVDGIMHGEFQQSDPSLNEFRIY
jgi:hypothetical protein